MRPLLYFHSLKSRANSCLTFGFEVNVILSSKACEASIYPSNVRFRPISDLFCCNVYVQLRLELTNLYQSNTQLIESCRTYRIDCKSQVEEGGPHR